MMDCKTDAQMPRHQLSCFTPIMRREQSVKCKAKWKVSAEEEGLLHSGLMPSLQGWKPIFQVLASWCKTRRFLGQLPMFLEVLCAQ